MAPSNPVYYILRNLFWALNGNHVYESNGEQIIYNLTLSKRKIYIMRSIVLPG